MWTEATDYGLQQLANVQSVEVLKGAGAILYGLSEPGGIVNIVTKQPLDAPYYAVNTAGRLAGGISHDDRRHRPSHCGQVRALSDEHVL